MRVGEGECMADDVGLPEQVGRWTLERVLLVLTFTCSCLAFVFGIGVQWARTTSIEASVSALKQDYVPREVYQADQLRLSQAIDRLTVSLDRLVEDRITDRRADRAGR